MPGLAARLETVGNGRFFLKAVPLDSPARDLYLREAEANSALGGDAIAPLMLWWSVSHGWVVMVFEYVEGREADLSPGSSDLPEVTALLRRLASLTVWPDAPPVARNMGALRDKAGALLAGRTGGEHRKLCRTVLERFDQDSVAGDRLVHYDLSPGNLRISGGGLKVLDWSFACAGADWLDPALLLPRFIEAGHTPAQAEALMTALPAWRGAPADGVTGLAVLWTLFREYKAMHGPEELRSARRRAADAGRAWIEYRAA
ncbi:phosphotransferase family protein [Actinomadura gamaensis]|uniref:Phosphotransferase family protein n=1 Tax=Actinomadura gamaensis TaxID=1763541 RepID=A0ABV9TRA6_9ACTN